MKPIAAVLFVLFVRGASCRLPDTTEPVSYALRVRPPATADGGRAFSGRVDVVVRARRYAAELVLHASGLNVTAVTAFEDVGTGGRVPVRGHALDRDAGRLTIALARPMVPRRLYRFAVGFEGETRDDYTGLHGHVYGASGGDGGGWMTMTRFEPRYARTAFPCYDEPRFKTPYNISVARTDGRFALSNTPAWRSEVDVETGWTWDHFETTRPIPTYLVAFAVTDFRRNTVDDGNGRLAVYARHAVAGRTAYMTRKASGLLDAVERLLRTPNASPKLDIVAVPSPDDYSVGGCGLDSYREDHLTVSNGSTAEDQMVGTMTVLREIIHRWFGNTVTAPRWDYAWLNVGLRNYLSYYVTATTEPDWDVDGAFVDDVHQRALAWDEADDARPLTFAASEADAFDPIGSYKSAAVFRMLRHAVGRTNFETALNRYLDDYAYTGPGPKELWETFDGVLYDAEWDIADDDITVNDTMYLWTERAGYPLVTVDHSNGSAILTQKRFTVSDTAPDPTKWFVGLTYTTESNADFDNVAPAVWLRPADERKVIPVPANSGWLVFNLQSTGFYRVNYDEKNWKLLLIQLVTRHDRIHVLNRAQIVDDACHLCRAGLVPYDYYISLLEYLLTEDHVTPWNAAIDGLSSITAAIRRYPADHATFKKYVKNLAEILYGKLSRNRMSNVSTKIGWSKLLAWSCRSGSSGCEKSALGHFDAWMKGRSVPPEMEEASFCAGMKHGDRAAWTKMYEYQKAAESSSSSRRAALRALACIENVGALSGYLWLVRSDRGDRVKTVLDGVASTQRGVKALADYSLRELLTTGTDGHAYAAYAYSALASKVATDDEMSILDEIGRSVVVGPAHLRAHFDGERRKALSNVEWMERDHGRIARATVGVV